jgi:hypothetical protein
VAVSLAFLATGLLLLVSSAAPAQSAQRLAGRTLDGETGEPLPLVELSLVLERGSSPVAAIRTGEDGRFVLERPGGGAYLILARRVGYAPVVHPIPDSLWGAEGSVELRLARRAEELAPVATTGRTRRTSFLLEGFEERRRLGRGTFISRDDIEARGWPGLMYLLRGIPGLTIDQGTTRSSTVMGLSMNGTRRCQPLIFLDGVQMTRAEDSFTLFRDVLESVSGTDLTAVEVYKGLSELPPRTGGAEARCGAIVVWTKRPDDELRRRRERETAAPANRLLRD